LGGKEANVLRTLALLLGGVFAGAVAIEIAHKKCPGSLDKLYSKMGTVASGVKDGFKEGYDSALKARQLAHA
jgi:hypothetical protein